MMKNHSYLNVCTFLSIFVFDDKFLVLRQIIIPLNSKLQYSPFHWKMNERVLLTWTCFIRNTYKSLKLPAFSDFRNNKKQKAIVPTTIENRSIYFCFLLFLVLLFYCLFLLWKPQKVFSANFSYLTKQFHKNKKNKNNTNCSEVHFKWMQKNSVNNNIINTATERYWKKQFFSKPFLS